MEKRAARLAPVVDMASKAERDAATQLGKCQQQLLAAQQKLAELQRYRNDYHQQWISQGQKGVSGQWLMNYQRFLSQLETAVTQQANSVAWHREAVDKARLNWQEIRSPGGAAQAGRALPGGGAPGRGQARAETARRACPAHPPPGRLTTQKNGRDAFSMNVVSQ